MKSKDFIGLLLKYLSAPYQGNPCRTEAGDKSPRFTLTVAEQIMREAGLSALTEAVVRATSNNKKITEYQQPYREESETEEPELIVPEPSDFSRLCVRLWQERLGAASKKMMQIGSSGGGDAVYFARSGFDVTLVDGSASALKRTADMAFLSQVGMTRIYCQLDGFHFHLPYGILYSSHTVEFLGNACLPLMERLRDEAPVGSMHAFQVMTREHTPTLDDLYRFEPSELKFHYRRWRILSYSEGFLWHEGTMGYLSSAQIVAVRE